MQSELLVFMKSEFCCECGKTPSNACFIRENGPSLYFNLMPLCVKHMHEHQKIGTSAMVKKYRNINRYLIHKGWVIEKTVFHKDLKES
jgi:NMD protein affecting ribosome stability and mRNA decay